MNIKENSDRKINDTVKEKASVPNIDDWLQPVDYEGIERLVTEYIRENDLYPDGGKEP